ncbi:Floral homeotic protein AGAMOUS [Vitis vinifera]|uniref:Floral homeotic protein AGAMOUS n=1 Tax=Vitis vinifera TaxID=29760 RepID=A0A438CDQ3_VITVI|nr:Floral homeotic protein AGAMOUS [Vitis vinifera]
MALEQASLSEIYAPAKHVCKKEIDLHNDNQYLRARIAENERNEQQMSLMPGGANYELMPSQQFDSRNYFQLNGLQPNQSYSRQDQPALQLV